MQKIPRTKSTRPALTQNNEKTYLINEMPIVFGFKYFHGESVQIQNFNNHYENCFKAITAIKDFHIAIAELSKLTLKEAFSPKTKRQLHLHPIETTKETSLINKILSTAYNFPEKLIDEFCEGQYFEFSFDNGQRAIAIKHDFIIEPLFLDPNHLIYRKSCKNDKEKLKYNSPSLLSPNIEEKILNELS